MSTPRTAVFPHVRFSRRIPDPNFHRSHGVERHILFVPARAIPQGLPTDPNPRGTNLNRLVYRSVRQSLLNHDCEPGTFHLKHKGVTLLADSVEKKTDDEYAVRFGENHGILDGRHTYELIMETQETEAVPDDQYVKFEVLVGVPDDWRVEISGGLNSAVQVQPMSLYNMEGLFDWIQDEIEGEPYADQVAWFENADGELDARDVVSLLTCLNVDLFPNDGDKQPVKAYSSKARTLAWYEKDIRKESSSFRKLQPILKDILILYDTIRYQARELWNAEGGQFGSFTFVDERKRDPFVFPFIEKTAMYRLMNAAALPMLAAFRWMVEENPETGDFRWRGGFNAVLKRWQDSAVELVNQTAGANKELGRNPNALGKSRNHWSNLHARVAMRDLMSRSTQTA